jgi:hypothetical protein
MRMDGVKAGKFIVGRLDGEVSDPDSVYFVLRLDGEDHFERRVARDVLFTYADRLQGTNEGDAALAALNKAYEPRRK